MQVANYTLPKYLRMVLAMWREVYSTSSYFKKKISTTNTLFPTSGVPLCAIQHVWVSRYAVENIRKYKRFTEVRIYEVNFTFSPPNLVVETEQEYAF